MPHALHMAYTSRIKASVGSPINLLVEDFGTGTSGLMLITKDDTLTGVALHHWEAWVSQARDHTAKRTHLPWLLIVPKISNARWLSSFHQEMNRSHTQYEEGTPWRPKTNTHQRHHRTDAATPEILHKSTKATVNPTLLQKELLFLNTRNFLYGWNTCIQ